MALTATYSSRPFVTTDEVLTEYLNYFAEQAESTRRSVAATIRRLMGARSSDSSSKPGFLSGRLALDEKRSDKGYSLTDCISRQTMLREGWTDVLTRDRHFQQEGFGVLFRS